MNVTLVYCMIMTKNCGPICTGAERKKILKMMAHHLQKNGRDRGKIPLILQSQVQRTMILRMMALTPHLKNKRQTMQILQYQEMLKMGEIMQLRTHLLVDSQVSLKVILLLFHHREMMKKQAELFTLMQYQMLVAPELELQ
uniref:Uncharacterized protein n=1 Tax=Arundo donax TaxID=35708 RepID=A0A0A9DBU7_ARUDO